MPKRSSRSASIERERKFLVPKLPRWVRNSEGERIQQGYLAIGADRQGTEVRVRQKGKQPVLTVKRREGDGRTEREVKLTRQQFAPLWPLTANRRVEKVRYKVPAGSNCIEVDVYRGKLRGLVTAEVEFSSAREMARFVPPPWLGREVTGQSRFSNARLAVAQRRPRVDAGDKE